jgi:hypothetical protein
MSDSTKYVPRRTVRDFKKSQEVVISPTHIEHHDISVTEPLEIKPVISAVREYARKTHSIGALQGAHAMQALIDEIKALGPHSNEICDLLQKGEGKVKELKSYLHKAYKELEIHMY